MILNNIKTQTAMAALALVMSAGMLGGCKNKDDQAIDAAKQQAAATGQPQQVVATDKDGNTTTTTVEPPLAGQTTQRVTTTKQVRNGNSQSVTTSTKDVTAAAPGPVTNGAPVVANGAPVVANTAAPYPNGPAPVNGQPYVAGQPRAVVANGDGTFRPEDVDVPAGTSLAIRINQHISVKTTPAGSEFTGEVVEPIANRDGRILIPKGTRVGGVVDASHKRGHFKGASILELRLTSMELHGQRYRLDTRDNVRTKKGKGKRSAAFIGGGTGLGMLVGGLAGGGVGLAVGGLAGAGAGTAVAGMTGNRDLDIPSESIMRFRLAHDLAIQQ